MKTYTFLILFFSINSIIAQDVTMFKKIEEVGYKFVTPLKNGEIAHLKNRKPPKNMWTYAALEKYKKYLDARKFISYGSYICPAKKKDFYNFNFYAIKNSETGESYFFIASVIISVKNDTYKIVSSYLFTEKETLKAWWHSTVNFFRSDDFNKVPKEFIKPNIFPPPPGL